MIEIKLPKRIGRADAEKLLNMLFGVVPEFEIKGTTMTIENPTGQMERDAQMIVDVLKREMGLPVVDEEKVHQEELVARLRELTDDTGSPFKARDIRDALLVLAELVGADVWTAKVTANDAKKSER